MLSLILDLLFHHNLEDKWFGNAVDFLLFQRMPARLSLEQWRLLLLTFPIFDTNFKWSRISRRISLLCELVEKTTMMFAFYLSANGWMRNNDVYFGIWLKIKTVYIRQGWQPATEWACVQSCMCVLSTAAYNTQRHHRNTVWMPIKYDSEELDLLLTWNRNENAFAPHTHRETKQMSR